MIELDFDGQEIVSEEIAKLIQDTPKERRLQRKIDPEIVKNAVKRRKREVSNRLMIRRALSNFSPEMQAGLELDLKKKTREEVMRKLVPVGASKEMKKKQQDKQNKKNQTFKQVFE